MGLNLGALDLIDKIPELSLSSAREVLVDDAAKFQRRLITFIISSFWFKFHVNMTLGSGVILYFVYFSINPVCKKSQIFTPRLHLPRTTLSS